MEAKDNIRAQFPSHPKYVAVARDLVYRMGRLHGFSARGAFDLKIVCGEAFTNIIKHAYESRDDRPIFLEVALYPGFLEMQFRDMGKQIPISPHDSKDLSDYRERGLGLYLISQLSDYHFFDQSMSVGTRLVVKKKIC